MHAGRKRNQDRSRRIALHRNEVSTSTMPTGLSTRRREGACKCKVLLTRIRCLSRASSWSRHRTYVLSRITQCGTLDIFENTLKLDTSGPEDGACIALLLWHYLTKLSWKATGSVWHIKSGTLPYEVGRWCQGYRRGGRRGRLDPAINQQHACSQTM